MWMAVLWPVLNDDASGRGTYTKTLAAGCEWTAEGG